jgi:hypothetical protein
MRMETEISFAAVFQLKISRREKRERRHAGNHPLHSPKSLSQLG